MADSPPSVPVESREQPRDALKQQMERRLWADGGVIINSRKVPEESVRQMREYAARTCASVADATIRELRAEVEAKETLLRTMDHFAEVAERCEAKSNAYLAERDRARDLAAHLEARLTEVEQELRDAENQAYELSMGEDL